ncbi:MAG: C-GCAxxG-C-C family protein [Firmicutes bacterium]|nr:C-GCAxxG-C-C family protein [Bacillota bacterium]
MDRKEQALALHKHGFNCAQSVACSFCNVMGTDPETTFRLAEPFGFGLGAMETCGVISGMAMVVGMKMSDGNLDAPKTKRDCYKMMQQLISEFKEKNGSIICREIKGVDTGNVLRTCDGCIEDAVELLDKHLLGL